MKSSKKNRSFPPQQKSEMLADARDPKRREDFRKVRALAPKMTFEEYVLWLTQITGLFPEQKPRKFVEYKRALL